MGPTMDDNDDDDMVMIIVGDVDANANNQDVKPIPPISIPIKEEPIKEERVESKWDPDSIIETAELHGQNLTSIKEDQSLKEEYFDYEYLEDPKKENGDESSSEKEEEASDAQKKPLRSYIIQLRKNFPKMRKDDEYIVAHLTEMMKQTKPPLPPINFYTEVDNKLVCAFCGKESPTLPVASRHYQVNHGTRYLTCYACSADYKCTASLYKHEKRCRAADAELVLRARGRYLGRKGRTRPFLTDHKFNPWGIDQDQPRKRNRSHVSRGEKQNVQLKQINKSHDSQGDKQKDQPKKRVFCAECPASFRKADALRAHELMHRGERPYQCDQCPVAYTSPIALKNHLQKHANVEYICDICGQSCKIKRSLIVHMNTHLPQRKFPCDRCDRRFSQKHALQHHINRDHLHIPPPLVCPACPKRFPRVSNLNAHMKAKHGLAVMTRKMFFKALPSMKDQELKQATVVFNQTNDNMFAISKNSTGLRPKGYYKKKKETESHEEYSTTNFPGVHVKEVVVNTTNDVVETVPKKAAVKTSLNSCEIEFASFIANRDKSLKTKRQSRIPRVDLSLPIRNRQKIYFLQSKKQTPKVDVNVAKMHEKIKETCGRNIPDVIADNSQEIKTEETELNVDPIDLEVSMYVEVTNVEKDNILRNKNLPVKVTRGKAASQVSVKKREVKTVAQKKIRVKNKRDAK